MQLKSLFYIASAFVVALARSSVSDVVASINNIDATVTILHQAIANFPDTGATTAIALDVHNKATDTVVAIQDATATASELEGVVTAEVSSQVLGAFSAMAPLIQEAVDAIIAKKAIIANTAIGRSTAVVKLNLLDLLAAATQLENVLIPLAPAYHQPDAYALAANINGCLNRAIEVYS